MAQVLPFRGIIYNPKAVEDLADVITPPFDVITTAEQEQFYARSAHNVVRLILGKDSADDGPSQNPHSRAADYLRSWLSNRILVRDPEPAFYLTALDFTIDERPVTRWGLIALARLVPFEDGIILPHERTFTNVKSERLALMKACHANFCPIFAMVPDDQNLLTLFASLCKRRTPAIAITAHEGQRHRLWRITDADVQGRISAVLAPLKFYIADGHHRYETALNYRNWVRECHPNLPEDHPANFVMMYLSSMADPGLVIRAAHRMLKRVPATAIDRLLDRAAPYFEIETISRDLAADGGARDRFLAALRNGGKRQSIGMAAKDHRAYYCLRLKKTRSVDQLFGSDYPEPLRQLDVTVLTRLIFVEHLDFDRNRLDNEKLIAYTTDAREALGRVASGDFDACFILNPTGLDQVRNVADRGLVMPRKATYFYPKVTTGLVMNVLTPHPDAFSNRRPKGNEK
jgi:uncharacterized protein (DUF1015 family)